MTNGLHSTPAVVLPSEEGEVGVAAHAGDGGVVRHPLDRLCLLPPHLLPAAKGQPRLLQTEDDVTPDSL